MEIVILMLKVLGLAFLISKFTPIQWFVEFFMMNIKPENKIVGLFVNLFYVMITCMSCLSFWIGLITFQNLWLAILSYFIAYTYQKLE